MNKIDELEMKLKELSEEIEQLKEEKENEVWKPKEGEPYWFISHSGWVKTTVWCDTIVGKIRYEIGNVFRTQEEGEFRVEQLKVEAELRRFARPFVPNKENHYMRYNHESNTFYIDYLWRIQDGGIYFDTADIARKAIDTVGEERIKKYYFGVED